MAEQVIIEFIADTSKLSPVIDQLEALGQIDRQAAAQFRATNAELEKRAAVVKEASQEIGAGKKSIDDLDKAVQKLSADFQEAFQESLSKGLSSANEEFKKMGGGLNQTAKGATSAKAELKAMREEMIQLSRAGAENTERFKQLSAEAGELADTIGDVNNTISNTGSDTSNLDGLIGIAQGVTGAFAVAQGTMALFGEENEELQETLLKVNSAMAVMQGLTEITNVLQKDSSASLLVLNTQKKLETVYTNLQAAAESKNIIIKNLATAAQWALNIAMKANPIGILITAITLLTGALIYFTSNSKEAEEQQKNLNKALETSTTGFENYSKKVQNANARTTADMESNGAKQSAIMRQNLATAQKIDQQRENELNNLRKALSQNQSATDKDSIEAQNKIRARIKELKDERVQFVTDEYVAKKAIQNQFEAEMQQDRENAQKKQAESEQKAAAARDKSRQEELEKQRRHAQALHDIENATFNDQVDRYQRLVDDETASLETRLDAQKKAQNARKQLLTEQANFELQNKELTDTERLAIETKLQFGIKEIERDGLQQRATLREQDAERIKKEEEEALKNAPKMEDRKQVAITAAHKKGEEDRTKLSKDEALKRNLEIAAMALSAVQQVGAIISEIFKQQSDAELERIDGQKAALDEMVEAGMLTEEQASKRRKQLDAEERKAKTEQAKKDKAAAIFNAVITTSLNVIKALGNPPIPGMNVAAAAISAALGLAQIAVIAARPLPKFGKGKHSAWAGWGEVGETGPELVEGPHGMMLVTGPSRMYLSAADKVYSPKETARMIADSPRLRSGLGVTVAGGGGYEGVDYDRFGRAVGKNIPQVGFNFDEQGFSAYMRKGSDFTRYLAMRRGNM